MHTVVGLIMHSARFCFSPALHPWKRNQVSHDIHRPITIAATNPDHEGTRDDDDELLLFPVGTDKLDLRGLPGAPKVDVDDGSGGAPKFSKGGRIDGGVECREN